MGTTTPSLRLVGNDLTSSIAGSADTTALRRTVNQENRWGRLVRDLAASVGGLAQLESLDAQPLPDEPFTDGAVNPADRAFAAATSTIFDKQCDRELDIEFRTIGRRLLARAIANDPKLIRRTSRPERFAAGLMVAVLTANGRVGRAEGQMRAGDVARWFGMSLANDPAHRLVRAARFEPPYVDDFDMRFRPADRLGLPSPEFLHSSSRVRLVADRQLVIEAIEQHEMAIAGRRPTVTLDDGRARRGSLANVFTVTKGLTQSGQAMLLVGLTPLVPNAEPEVFVLDMAEAGRLYEQLVVAFSSHEPLRHQIGVFEPFDAFDHRRDWPWPDELHWRF